MYPDLSYILHALLGTSPDNWTSIVKTFGLLLVIAILTAAFMLAKELKRKEEEGLLKGVIEKRTIGAPASTLELIGNALLGFFLGFKFGYILQNFSDFQIDPAAIVFSKVGNWWMGIIGAILFAGAKYYEKNKDKLDKPKVQEVMVHPYERIGDITIIAAVSGIIGAKVFALLEDVDQVLNGTITFGDLISSFFSGSGMAIYGGLIGGFLAVFFFVKRKGINPIHVMDAVAPALMIAYGIGRLGCHFSGDGDWGIPVEGISKPAIMAALPDWLWAYNYPHNVISEGVLMDNCVWRYCKELSTPVFPTPLYEITMAAILGGILWALRKRITIPGMLFFIYLIFNGMERFWIEKIRVNEKYEVFGLNTTQAEFIAVILMIIGVIGCLVLLQRNKGVTTKKA